MIAAAGNAGICSWLGDVETARVLYDQLAAYSGLQAIGLSSTPYDGPVDLALGRLAATYGDAGLARTHLAAALRQCESMNALPGRAFVRAELAALGDTAATADRALATHRDGAHSWPGWSCH